MPQFRVEKVDNPERFHGDFRVVSDLNPTPPNQAIADLFNAALDALPVDIAADAAAAYSESVRAKRQAVRDNLVIGLRKLADNFVLNPPGNSNADIQAATKTYKDKLYRSALTIRPAKTPRFDGDFEIGGDAAAQPVIDAVNAATAEMAADVALDDDRFSDGVKSVRKEIRKECARELRDYVGGFGFSAKSEADAAIDIVLMRGQYQANRDRQRRKLFNVRESDLKISLLSGLPPPQDNASPEKQELFLQINRAHSIVRTVTEHIRTRAKPTPPAFLKGWSQICGWCYAEDGAELERAKRIETEFLQRFFEIARMGLELDFTVMAKQRLDEVRSDFFTRQAGRIKNQYVRQLGFWALIAVIILMTGYVMAYPDANRANHLFWGWAHEHRNFLLAATGAAIGTWVSFSARQVQFTFEDLTMVEESALDPPMRILFVIALTIAACLLFWTAALNIEIGNLKTGAPSFKETGSIGFLIGLFCGLSERGLATAITSRAASFVKTIG